MPASATVQEMRRRPSTSSCRAPGRPRSASSGSSARRWRRGRLRLQQGPRREGHPRQRQPDLRSGDRRQLSVREPRQPRPIPTGASISMNPHTGRSDYHALQTAFTKRFSNAGRRRRPTRCRASGTPSTQPFSGLDLVPFPIAPDLGGEWGLSADDQRHRAVFNGIWQVGHGFQVSGLHYLRRRHRGSEQLRRRPARHRRRTVSAPPASGRHDRPAQRFIAAGAEPDRHAGAAADSAGRPRVDRWHRGSVQRVQPAELRASAPQESSRRSTCSTPGADARRSSGSG